MSDLLRRNALRLLVPVAVVLALAGAAVVEHARRAHDGSGSPPRASWVLFALAATALVAGASERAPLLVASSTPRPGLGRRRVLIAAFGAAVVLGGASIPLFIALNGASTDRAPGWLENDGAWMLWLVALAAFAAGVFAWSRARPAAAQPAPGWPPTLGRRVEIALLAGLTAAAVALRLPSLGSIPPGLWFDEAQNGLVARELTAAGATHAVFVADFTQMGALYFYALGAVLAVFGDAIWVLRLLPALAGALTVPLLYALASRLYGWRIGLVAASLLAVSSWNITISRFGLASMPAVALDLAVYFCVVQGLRTGRVGWYAAGGVLLGLDLHGYYVARLVPFVLLVVLLHLVLRNRAGVARMRAGAAVFAAGAVLGALPVLVFAAQKPHVYEARVPTTSIFSDVGSGGDPHALRTSLRAHLLMFGYRGDGNGRHNVPGSPMLDWLTAGLFFAGLGVYLLRIARWEFLFPLAWFAAALSGGVLSLVRSSSGSSRRAGLRDAWLGLRRRTRLPGRRGLPGRRAVLPAGTGIYRCSDTDIDRQVGRTIICSYSKTLPLRDQAVGFAAVRHGAQGLRPGDGVRAEAELADRPRASRSTS